MSTDAFGVDRADLALDRHFRAQLAKGAEGDKALRSLIADRRRLARNSGRYAGAVKAAGGPHTEAYVNTGRASRSEARRYQSIYDKYRPQRRLP